MNRLSALLNSATGEKLRDSRGRRVAQLLAGSWKTAPPISAITSQEIEELTPLLLSMGAGGLAWGRLRRTRSHLSHALPQLQQAYRFQALERALHQLHLKQVIPHRRSFGVEPVLVKGRAIARRYPEPG